LKADDKVPGSRPAVGRAALCLGAARPLQDVIEESLSLWVEENAKDNMKNGQELWAKVGDGVKG
jgi:hypothetical protein